VCVMAHKLRTLLKDIYGKFACDYCKKQIMEKQRFVRLDTHDLIFKNTFLTELVEQKFYHIECWRRFLNDMIQRHFKVATMKIGSIAKAMLPKLKQAIDDGR